jgi:hypothetical protein
VLLPLVAIGYWKWRLRGRRPVGAVVRVTAPEAI